MMPALTNASSQLIGFPIRDWNQIRRYGHRFLQYRNWLDSLLGIETKLSGTISRIKSHRNWLDSLLGIETSSYTARFMAFSLSQLIGFPIRDWNHALRKPRGLPDYRNWLDSLLGIETWIMPKQTELFSNRNWLDSLLGIETSTPATSLKTLLDRNWLDSLLGIETTARPTGLAFMIAIDWIPY